MLGMFIRKVVIKHQPSFKLCCTNLNLRSNVLEICNELTPNLSGNIWPQSSQLTMPLSADPGIKGGISVCELISTSKTATTTKVQAGNEWSNLASKQPSSLQSLLVVYTVVYKDT